MSKKLEIVMTLPEKKLPSGWELATIGDLVGRQGVFKDGDWVESKDQDPNGDVRLIQLADIGDGEYRDRSSRFLTYEKALELRCTFINKGDVLVARMPDPLGRACIFPGDKKRSVTVVDVCIVRPEMDDISKRWLKYFINAPAFRAAVASLQSGSTRKRISRKNLAKISLPVPPSNEQKRIVEEIEKQFSRLDEAADNLKRVKANLIRYKASVLKAAVEGKLTEEWRAAHPDVEPADKLLQCILAERRKKWEEVECAKMKGKGKVPKDDKWKKKYKEPPQVDAAVLPELPDGWAWANFERLAEDISHALKAGPFGSSLKKSFYVPNGYKIYGQEQVLRNDPSYGDYYIDEERYEKLRNCSVKPGDILISLVGTVGKVLILPKGIEPGIINPRLVKLSLDRRLVDESFIKTYLQSPYVKYLFSIASHGGTMDILNLTILKEIPIPVPPLEEQKNIIEEIERISSIEIELNTVIEANITRVDRLRQSILKKAFLGELVTQDGNNEPADKLLDRIRTLQSDN